MVNGRAIWYESIPDKRITLPANKDEIPDFIFYYADENEEYRRHSFARVKASEILVDAKNQDHIDAKPRVIKLKEDRSLDLITDEEFPGFLYVQAHMYSVPPPRKIVCDPGNIIYDE